MSQTTGNVRDRIDRATTLTAETINDAVKIAQNATVDAARRALNERMAWSNAWIDQLKNSPMSRWVAVIMVASVTVILGYVAGTLFAWDNGRIPEAGYHLYTLLTVGAAFCTLWFFGAIYHERNHHGNRYEVVPAGIAFLLIVWLLIAGGFTTTYTIRGITIWSDCGEYWKNTSIPTEARANPYFYRNLILCRPENWWQFSVTSWLVVVIWIATLCLIVAAGYLFMFYLVPWNNARAIFNHAKDTYSSIASGTPVSEALRNSREKLLQEIPSGSANVVEIGDQNIGGLVMNSATNGHGNDFESLHNRKKDYSKSYRYMQVQQ
jgi:hypothetical protein